MKVLVTGGAGYIGSHTLLQLLRERHDAMVFDNFSNSSPEALKRVKQLANADFEICEGDIQDACRLNEAFGDFKPEVVIHFAGLKAVGESNEKPIEYYAQNVSGSIELLKAMQRHDCRHIVFSSSATVYGEAEYLPYDEDHPLRPTNPYGRTKYFIEEIIRDWVASWRHASAVLLRYFNPVGADASGRIGEDPNGIPNNLVPYIAQVAVGRLQHLNVFGADYDTRDGTGERDYIHVEDLARAHLAAIQFEPTKSGCEAINIGTGRSTTVLEMVKAFEQASGRAVPYQIEPRRDGDVAHSLAAVGKAERLLGWQAKLDVDDMCRTTWDWQSENPSGYSPD
ncbi:UDP-glucose 4-epimerase GalE [Roseibium sp. RKSG952]|uniref:UDP-glucose 4-epimerase GalE n=1 Tax=Roseibium sp. RKSG952 TaxID=2529384 RepID=UPI0012BD611D|nr:UDP-glucose 4-epimerase GalE [Roseibium sp. RKSG952]MTH94828.1 UDP-glucose 4-epimerase GalE [Roseibium sp. RKSG952]